MDPSRSRTLVHVINNCEVPRIIQNKYIKKIAIDGGYMAINPNAINLLY